MYYLELNDMRSPKIEHSKLIAFSSTQEALEKFLADEQVPGYSDGRFSKGYRQGGPLEWYNAPSSFFGHGINKGNEAGASFGILVCKLWIEPSGERVKIDMQKACDIMQDIINRARAGEFGQPEVEVMT